MTGKHILLLQLIVALFATILLAQIAATSAHGVSGLGHAAAPRCNATSLHYIYTEKAPQPIGPYSQAVEQGCTIYMSGQIGIDPATGQLVNGVDAQTVQALRNVDAVLLAAGSSKKQVMRCLIFLTDMNDFAKVNSIYEQYFEQHKPARSTVQIAALPKGALVEVECTAFMLP